MTTTKLKEKAKVVLRELTRLFPEASIELDYHHDDPWQLLVVVALSAQTTDKKVNAISKALFARFRTVKDFAEARSSEIEPYIRSIGLYRNKAKNLVLAAQKIVSDFDGVVPRTREELQSLAGVGKKTSAVVVAHAYNTPAIPVDTHVARVAYRLGLTKHRDKPEKIEDDLMALYPKSQWIRLHHVLIFHGRRVCLARKPYCSACPLAEICPRNDVKSSQ